MAEEPQPTENPPQPTAGEQKQEAAALSNLNTHTIDEDSSASKTQGPGDQAALGAALSHLSVGEQQKGKNDGVKSGGAAEERKKKEMEIKKVKIADEDVKFLVDELELSKKRATELLQNNEGNRMAAVRAFVVPAVKA